MAQLNVHPPRTRYPKGVKPPTDNMLKPGTNNAKLGGIVSVRKWQGAAMYSLTLEERATCPTSCDQWENCYGNNMPFAHRFDHTAPDFYDKLEAQLAKLNKKHGQGFVVRLHVLGDFFSLQYVGQWAIWLQKFENLRVFGYTHRPFNSQEGLLINVLNSQKPERWQIRFSDEPATQLSAHVVDDTRVPVKGSEVICPEQQGKSKSCSDCGLCWSAPNLKILFVEH